MHVRQDDDLLFKNWHWGKCLDYLYNNICYQCSNLVLIRGALDSGKTTLLQELIRLLPDNCKVFSMFGENKIKLGVVELIKKITIGFAIPCDSNNLTSWEELQRAICEELRFNWVILIDDAEKLSWEHVSSLLSLYNRIEIAGGQLSLILFSDFTFNEKFNQPLFVEFMESKLQIIDLQHLTLEQMNEFLNEKMQLQFNHSTLKKVYNASDGLIGKIKHLAMSELNISSKRENTVIKNLLNNIFNQPVGRVIACSGFLLLSYIAFNMQKNYNKQDLLEDRINNTYTATSENQHELIELSEGSNQSRDKKIAYNIDQENLEKPSDIVDNLCNQLQTIRVKLNKIQDQVNGLSASIQSLQVAELHIPKASNKLKSINLHTLKPIKNSTYMDSLHNYEKQLLKVNKKFYVLQIMSSKNEQSIKNLINQYSPLCSDRIKYASGNLKPHKERWYIAWYGIYNDKQSALKDLSNLPKELQKLNPIIKDYSAVHKLINSKEA